MNSNNKKESNPKDICFLRNITKDSYTNGILDNTFIVFISINDLLYLIYSKRNSIISFDLNNNKKINEIKNAHNEDISNFRHCLDKINKKDFLLSISKNINNIKLWDVKNFECLLNIEKINKFGYLYSSCFLNYNNQIFIITSNWNLSFSEYLKIFDLKGNKIKEINNSNDKTFFIDTYYDQKLSKIYIITSNQYNIKSYDFKNNKLFYEYSDDSDINEHCNIIIYNKNNLIELIEASPEGKIRIWDFNSGKIIYKISLMNNNLSFSGLTTICLWDNDYLFIGCIDKTIKLLELKSGNNIKNLIGHTESVLCIKKVKHPQYGDCLISQGRRYDQIKIWANKRNIK